jgi:hypothetical protein
MLILGVCFWAAPLFGWQSAVEKWNPRKTPANAEFVGDKVCAECHGNKVASHSASGMAMAMESVADSRVLTANPTMAFRAGPYSFEIKRSGRQSFYTITDGKETISVPIMYAFGQGKAGQTYVFQYEGAFYEGLVSYFKEVGGLDFTIGHARTVPQSLKQALGRRLSEGVALNCFGCHSTGGTVGRVIRLDKMTPGIRCESCHGPGAQHVGASQEGKPSAKLIFNPRRLSGDELTQDFCASCHQVGDTPSLTVTAEVNSVRFQPYRIFHSKCYSDDRRISCTACHDPHEPLKQDAAYYDAKCMACHMAKGKQVEAGAKQGEQSLIAGCRVGTRDCVSCHMPKVAVAEAHFKFTDHYIRVVKPKETHSN